MRARPEMSFSMQYACAISQCWDRADHRSVWLMLALISGLAPQSAVAQGIVVARPDGQEQPRIAFDQIERVLLHGEPPPAVDSFTTDAAVIAVIGAKSGTKLLIGGGCALSAVVVIAIAVGRMSQSPAAASAALASAAPVFAPPNSPVSPTPASSPKAPPNTGLCGCADIPAIQDGIREAQAVIPLYQAEMNKLQASTPVPPYFSQSATGIPTRRNFLTGWPLSPMMPTSMD